MTSLERISDRYDLALLPRSVCCWLRRGIGRLLDMSWGHSRPPTVFVLASVGHPLLFCVGSHYCKSGGFGEPGLWRICLISCMHCIIVWHCRCTVTSVHISEHTADVTLGTFEDNSSTIVYIYSQGQTSHELVNHPLPHSLTWIISARQYGPHPYHEQ